jgi:hypothetical protein
MGVEIEGFVTSQWKFQNNRFVRIACYRYNYQPQKNSPDGREVPDYVTLCFPNAVELMAEFSKGTKLHVVGFLESSDYNESLAEFLEKAEKEKTLNGVNVETTGGSPKDIFVKRSGTVVVVEHVAVVGHKDDGKPANENDNQSKLVTEKVKPSKPETNLANKSKK